MQQLQHKRFTTMPTDRQAWNDQLSLPISYTYVQLRPGFVAIDNVSDNNKIRPWFKRYEA